MYLNCKTWFSLRYGTYTTENLVKEAAGRNIPALALTNINSTADTWDFVDYCQGAGIRPVAGAEVRNGDELCYVLLAKNNAGFLEINRFLSLHLQARKPFPERPGLGEQVYVIYPLGKCQPADLASNELIGVQTTEINKLFSIRVNEHPGKWVIRHPVTFQDKRYYNVHRLLRCIDKNILLSRQQPAHIAGTHECFMEPAEILQAFRNHPGIITNTLRVMEQCSIGIDFRTDKTRRLFSSSAADDRQLLEKLAWDGFLTRYDRKNKVAAERVRKELEIINDLGFNTYFLTTWDILRYARNRNFFYVGRGSGGNSIVAYCLRITDVDPVALDLYFERFLNPYRASPPDFDLDFSWKDRDEITDYIFKRFGSEYVSLLGSYSTFQERAVIRELGKVFGLPKKEIDALEHPSATFTEDKIQRQILHYGYLLKDFPNHLSVHVGGVLISEAPINQYAVTELPPKGFPTTQIDMFVAEKIGLYKLDVLSQRGLGHIKDTVEIVRQNRGISIDIHDVEGFKKDREVAEMIRSGNTVGCFYIESPAMRQLLTKLRCDNYPSLVIASSVIRPGVASSGMMRQYIHYFHHPDKVVYLHPKLQELLPETFGIMIFQEDVIKVVHFLGRLDLAKADVVRKGMSGKYRGAIHFEKLKEEFFENCKADGIDEKTYTEIWRLIDSFKGYSFSKAHSASYAVESYQSLYLKTHFPAEFMVGVINNFGGFYSTELYFHELRKTGATIAAPCVNEGEYLTSIRGNRVHVGFVHIDSLSREAIEGMLEERKRNGPFLHLQDFVERTSLSLEQLNLLVRVGAFRFTGRSKKELLWDVNFVRKKTLPAMPGQTALFKPGTIEVNLPQLTHTALEDAFDELELLGFPICNAWNLVAIDTSPFATAAALPGRLGKYVRIIGLYVNARGVSTKTNQQMYFGTFLDKEGNWFYTVHFPGSFQWAPFQGRGFYAMIGKVVEEFGAYSIEVVSSRKVGIRRLE